jgi:hypothetical protein
MGWAFFSKTHLVTLPAVEIKEHKNRTRDWEINVGSCQIG